MTSDALGGEGGKETERAQTKGLLPGIFKGNSNVGKHTVLLK